MPIPNFSACITVTIPQSATDSNVFDTMGAKIAAIGLPSAMTGTTMTLKGHATMQSTGKPICKDSDGSAYSLTIAASKVISLDASAAATPCRYMSLVSGSAEVAARTIEVYLK